MINLLILLNFISFNPKKVLKGTWRGAIDHNTLIVVIEEIKGNQIFGYNQLGVVKRPISGIFQETEWDQACSKAYLAVLKEPGDNRFDGVFTIKFVGYEDQKEGDSGIDCIGNLKGIEGQGEWRSYRGKRKKEFFLFKN